MVPVFRSILSPVDFDDNSLAALGYAYCAAWLTRRDDSSGDPRTGHLAWPVGADGCAHRRGQQGQSRRQSRCGT